MPNVLLESQIEKRVQDELNVRDSVREVEYKNKFNELRTELVHRADSFLSESITESLEEKIDASAKLQIYAPIVEGIIKVLKENGIKSPLHEQVDTSEHEELLVEAIDKINNLRVETDKLQKMIKIYETITKHLSGLEQDVIDSAVAKFKDKDISESLLEEELTEYVLKHKASNKRIAFESIDEDDLDEINELDSLLEGTAKPFSPKVKLDIKGIKPRKVYTEAIELNESEDYDPAQEMLKNWSGSHFI